MTPRLAQHSSVPGPWKVYQHHAQIKGSLNGCMKSSESLSITKAMLMVKIWEDMELLDKIHALMFFLLIWELWPTIKRKEWHTVNPKLALLASRFNNPLLARVHGSKSVRMRGIGEENMNWSVTQVGSQKDKSVKIPFRRKATVWS